MPTLCLDKPTTGNQRVSPSPEHLVSVPSDSCNALTQVWATKAKKGTATNVMEAQEKQRWQAMTLQSVVSKSKGASRGSGDLTTATGHQPHQAKCGSGHSGTCHVTSLTLSQVWPSVAKCGEAPSMSMRVDIISRQVASVPT
jgi:hypothetical protein